MRQVQEYEVKYMDGGGGIARAVLVAASQVEAERKAVGRYDHVMEVREITEMEAVAA